jgi:hypothetical protein
LEAPRRQYGVARESCARQAHRHLIHCAPRQLASTAPQIPPVPPASRAHRAGTVSGAPLRHKTVPQPAARTVRGGAPSPTAPCAPRGLTAAARPPRRAPAHRPARIVPWAPGTARGSAARRGRTVTVSLCAPRRAPVRSAGTAVPVLAPRLAYCAHPAPSVPAASRSRHPAVRPVASIVLLDSRTRLVSRALTVPGALAGPPHPSRVLRRPVATALPHLVRRCCVHLAPTAPAAPQPHAPARRPVARIVRRVLQPPAGRPAPRDSTVQGRQQPPSTAPARRVTTARRGVTVVTGASASVGTTVVVAAPLHSVAPRHLGRTRLVPSVHAQTQRAPAQSALTVPAGPPPPSSAHRRVPTAHGGPQPPRVPPAPPAFSARMGARCPRRVARHRGPTARLGVRRRRAPHAHSVATARVAVLVRNPAWLPPGSTAPPVTASRCAHSGTSAPAAWHRQFPVPFNEAPTAPCTPP